MITQKLDIINEEPDTQKRLALLVKYGFLTAASQLIRNLLRVNTALFLYDWHDERLCQPLPRVTSGSSAVYVIITPCTKLDFHPYHRKEGEWHVVFELGWECQILGWTKEESAELVRGIVYQALARPLSQWSLKQAEGTGRAARQMLSANDVVACQVAAHHLIFQLRQADFGHICTYLAEIKGFPFAGGGSSVPLYEEGVVNWIVDQLLELGWPPDRIHKELVEWIWLKMNTWPQWLLAVAKAKIFAKEDPVRVAAVRHWICQGFSHLLDVVLCRNDLDEVAEVYRQLFQMGQFGLDDKGWICDKLVERMVLGKVWFAEIFIQQFGAVLELDTLDSMISRALNAAASAGNYGVAVALARRINFAPHPSWVRMVKVRGLSTNLG